MLSRRIFGVIAVAALLAAGCDTGDGDTEGTTAKGKARSLTSKQASLSVSQNIKSAFDNLDDALKLLDESTLFDLIEDMLPEGEEKHEAGGAFPPCPEGGSSDPEHPCSPMPEIPKMPEEPEGKADAPKVVDRPGEGEEEEGFDAREIGKDIVEFLDDHVLVDSIKESEDGTTVVYLLDPVTSCPEEEEEENKEGEGENKADDGKDEDKDDDLCQRYLTEVEVRISITSYGEGDVDVALLFGAEQLNPLTFELHQDHLAVRLDLGAAMEVVKKMLEVAEEEEEAKTLPEVLEGVIEVSLDKTGAEAASFRLAVLEPIKVRATDGEDTVAVSLGKSEVKVDVDAVAETGTLDVNVGTLTASFPRQLWADALAEDCGEDGEHREAKMPPEMPDAPKIPEGGEGHEGSDVPKVPDQGPEHDGEREECKDEERPDVEGTMGFTLGGLTFTVSFDGNSEDLNLGNAGLGEVPSTLELDGTEILSLAVNGSYGNVFDLFASEGAAKDVILELVPAFEVILKLNLEPVAEDFEDLPEWARDETLKLLLDGDDKPTVAFLHQEREEHVGESREGDGYDGGGHEGEGPDNDKEEKDVEVVRVDKGTLTISAASAPEDTVTVAEGQCLFAIDDDDEKGHGENGEGEGSSEEPEGHEILRHLTAGTCGE